jgi:hypothetical protein
MKAVAFDNADWTNRHDVEIFPGRVTSGVMVGDHISLIVWQSWLVCGRRAGKSFTLALCAVYFTVKERSARPGRNPKTGSVVSVTQTAHAAFRTGLEMHRRLNPDFQP